MFANIGNHSKNYTNAVFSSIGHLWALGKKKSLTIITRGKPTTFQGNWCKSEHFNQSPTQMMGTDEDVLRDATDVEIEAAGLENWKS